jgi:hypothetical protein
MALQRFNDRVFDFVKALGNILTNLDTGGMGDIIQEQLMRGRAEAARQAHNLKVIGSNPIPATKSKPETVSLRFLFTLMDIGIKISFRKEIFEPKRIFWQDFPLRWKMRSARNHFKKQALLCVWCTGSIIRTTEPEAP